MSNEISPINSSPVLSNEQQDINNESARLAEELYQASHFYAQCLGKGPLSKYSEDFHQSILSKANEVKFSQDPVATVQFYLNKIKHTVKESGKTNYINPDFLKTSVSIAWREITGLALPSALLEDKKAA